MTRAEYSFGQEKRTIRKDATFHSEFPVLMECVMIMQMDRIKFITFSRNVL